MEQLFNVNPSDFILRHLNDPAANLAIGSTILYDKLAKYESIPLDRFTQSINERYLTTVEIPGSIIIWEIIGYK